MANYKLKNHKPEYKTKFKKKSKQSKFFENMLKNQENQFYIKEQLIEEQIEKMMCKNYEKIQIN